MVASSTFRSLLLALALAGPAALHAQQVPVGLPNGTTALPQPTSSRALVYRAAPPEQRADKMSQEMAHQLGLDAPTTAKVRAAALTRAQKIDAIQNGTDSNKAKNTALEANAKEFKAALQGILTPAQYAQYTSTGGKGKTMKAKATPTATPPTTPTN